VAARHAAVEVVFVEAHHVAVDVTVNESLKHNDASVNGFVLEQNTILSKKRRGVP
jgi:hypothetical protein